LQNAGDRLASHYQKIKLKNAEGIYLQYMVKILSVLKNINRNGNETLLIKNIQSNLIFCWYFIGAIVFASIRFL